MKTALLVTHWLFVLCMPILLVGVVNRTKSWWAARKGPRIIQFAFDLRRLLGKRPVESTTATALFRAGAWIVLIAGVFAAAMAPMLGQFAPLQFSHDFIVVAYAMGLARIALMISAMDVGSSFEGMGTAREAAFSTYAEPALFLLIGTAGAATGMTSFADLIGHLHHTPYYAIVVAPLVVWLGSTQSAHVTGKVFESQGGRISVGDGWRTGVTRDKGGQWQPEEIGVAMSQILAEAPAPQRVWGS